MPPSTITVPIFEIDRFGISKIRGSMQLRMARRRPLPPMNHIKEAALTAEGLPASESQ